MANIIAQFGIVALGMPATLLVNMRNRWGVLLGLAGQPCWYYVSYTGRQWGVFAMTFAYTASWLVGVYTWWVRPSGVSRQEGQPG